MSAFEDETEVWHRARIQRLKSPEGWLSLVAKAFLEPGMSLTVGSGADRDVRLPRGPHRVGTFSRTGNDVRVALEEGVATLDDVPVAGERALRTDALGNPDRLRVDGMTLDVMQRGETIALRVRDPEAPARVGLGTIARFPVDPNWRVSARFVAAATPTREWIDFGSGIADELISPGILEFDIAGTSITLRALYEDTAQKRLYILFRDGTSGSESYGLGRFLYAPLPENGRVVLDFNRCLLPGCAFNELATCPIPSRENRTSVRITAGEKDYTPPWKD